MANELLISVTEDFHGLTAVGLGVLAKRTPVLRFITKGVLVHPSPEEPIDTGLIELEMGLGGSLGRNFGVGRHPLTVRYNRTPPCYFREYPDINLVSLRG